MNHPGRAQECLMWLCVTEESPDTTARFPHPELAVQRPTPFFLHPCSRKQPAFSPDGPPPPVPASAKPLKLSLACEAGPTAQDSLAPGHRGVPLERSSSGQWPPAWLLPPLPVLRSKPEPRSPSCEVFGCGHIQAHFWGD